MLILPLLFSYHLRGPNDVIPKHGIHDVPYLDNDDENSVNELSDVNDSHGHNYNTKGANAFSGFGATPKKGISVKQRMCVREKKRVSSV